MFFNKKKIINENTYLVKIGALLIHAAKIDEKYSNDENKIIKKTLLELGADKENLDLIMKSLRLEKEHVLT